MKNEILAEVRALQSGFEESARDYFLDSELEHLRVIVRLTVEARHFLWTADSAEETQYLCNSIFSGVDSFGIVSAAYRSTEGPVGSTLAWPTMHLAQLKEEFATRFAKLVVEGDFELRCRILLDLFKLQIVFAGMSHE